jgi:hypothetical protein
MPPRRDTAPGSKFNVVHWRVFAFAADGRAFIFSAIMVATSAAGWQKLI